MRAALVISERDNVATALEVLEPGRRLDLNGTQIVIAESIASGHKVALRAIPAGHPVVKYGSPIGMASADIPAGAHVHTHNLSSSRGRGDLGVAPLPPVPRLAEPPDDASAGPDGAWPSPGAADAPSAGGTTETRRNPASATE